MTSHEDSDANGADMIAAYERGELFPVSDQDRARMEAAAAARRYLERRQIKVVGDVLAPVNPDWNVGEDL